MTAKRTRAVFFACAAALAVPAIAAPGFVRDAAAPAEVPPAKDDWVADPRQAASLYADAQRAFADDRAAEALRLVTRAIEMDHETNPAERGYYVLRAGCLARLGDPRPDQAARLYNTAMQSAGSGDFAAARRLYERALVDDPLFLWAANNRAWLAATHPDADARRDPDAVAYALYACTRSNWHNWSFIDTLGAAYAESGDFAAAARCAERALVLAPPEQKQEIRVSLVDYRNKRPRRNPAAAVPPAGEDGRDTAVAEDPFQDDANPGKRRVVLTQTTLPDIARAMEREGYAVTIRDGRFLEWKIEGVKCQIFVANDGHSIQFHTAFNDDAIALSKVNAWNRTKKFSRSYLDDDGDPHLELDLDFDGGICEDRVLDFLQTCRVSLDMWVKEVLR